MKTLLVLVVAEAPDMSPTKIGGIVMGLPLARASAATEEAEVKPVAPLDGGAVMGTSAMGGDVMVSSKIMDGVGVSTGTVLRPPPLVEESPLPITTVGVMVPVVPVVVPSMPVASLSIMVPVPSTQVPVPSVQLLVEVILPPVLVEESPLLGTDPVKDPTKDGGAVMAVSVPAGTVTTGGAVAAGGDVAVIMVDWTGVRFNDVVPPVVVAVVVEPVVVPVVVVPVVVVPVVVVPVVVVVGVVPVVVVPVVVVVGAVTAVVVVLPPLELTGVRTMVVVVPTTEVVGPV